MTEHPYVVQHNTQHSTAHQVRVGLVVKMQARSKCTVPKLTIPYQTKLYRSVETRLEYTGEDELGSSCSQYLSLLSVVH